MHAAHAMNSHAHSPNPCMRGAHHMATPIHGFMQHGLRNLYKAQTVLIPIFLTSFERSASMLKSNHGLTTASFIDIT